MATPTEGMIAMDPELVWEDVAPQPETVDENGAWQNSNVVRCPVCYAVVVKANKGGHSDWHDSLVTA